MRNSAEEVNELMEGKALSSLTAVDLLTDMYYTQNSLCPKNVSLQSSFICMLHLANEKGLEFGQPATLAEDFKGQLKAESDFTIKKVAAK